MLSRHKWDNTSGTLKKTDPQVKLRSLQWPPPKLFSPIVNARKKRIPAAIYRSSSEPASRL